MDNKKEQQEKKENDDWTQIYDAINLFLNKLSGENELANLLTTVQNVQSAIKGIYQQEQSNLMHAQDVVLNLRIQIGKIQQQIIQCKDDYAKVHNYTQYEYLLYRIMRELMVIINKELTAFINEKVGPKIQEIVDPDRKREINTIDETIFTFRNTQLQLNKFAAVIKFYPEKNETLGTLPKHYEEALLQTELGISLQLILKIRIFKLDRHFSNL